MQEKVLGNTSFYSVEIIEDVVIQHWHFGFGQAWEINDNQSRKEIIRLFKEYRFAELAKYIREKKLQRI